jgi:hypothetical protein
MFTARPDNKLEAVALDGRVEIDFALRDVAGGTQVVVELRAARMIHPGGEVHIIVASSTGREGRIGRVSGLLRRARRLRMASFAAPRVSRIRRKSDG